MLEDRDEWRLEQSSTDYASKSILIFEGRSLMGDGKRRMRRFKDYRDCKTGITWAAEKPFPVTVVGWRTLFISRLKAEVQAVST